METKGGRRRMSLLKSTFKLILGSSSMARRQILSDMGYEFSIMTADIDEKSIRKEKPEELVMALAEAKADAVISRLQARHEELSESNSPPTLLITADTVVVYNGVIREKPSNKDEARKFVRDYSGSHGSVVGSVLVTNLKTGYRNGGWESAEVYFYEIPDHIIDSLIEDGVTLNVAGGLMLEHPLTLPFVDSVVGTVDCVMGLSKRLTERLIRDALQVP
uniref:Maf-like protein n=1 Tax=Kalanchoe fedtschenkoi TaxID=63787 RepID=A0A7N0TDV4_KALFE